MDPSSPSNGLLLGDQRVSDYLRHPREISDLSCVPSLTDRCTSASRLPELEVGLFLIEVYFTRVFTSSLLFDYKTFVEDYRASDVPDDVLLSIFAMASLFLRPESRSPFSKKNGLAPFAAINERGRTWAESASHIVLANADRPSVSKIRACEILGLYWFAVGDLDRVAMHSSISREMCHIIQRKARFQRRSGDFRAVENAGVPLQIRYACWIKSCLIDSASWCVMCDVNDPNPQNDEFGSFRESDRSNATGPRIDRPAACDWMIWDDSKLQSSAAYCVKLLGLWREIKTLVRKSWNIHSAAYMGSVFEMDARLQKLYKTLPKELKREGLMRSNSSERIKRKAFFLRSIYYLCVVYLHASAVPGFSGSEASLQTSTSLADLFARTAILNAGLFAEMAKEYLASTPDFSKVPSFVGYCAFIAGSVHGVMLSHKETSQIFSSLANAISCLLILGELKVYWPVLSFMWRDLKHQISLGRDGQSQLSEITIRDLIFKPCSMPADTDRLKIPLPSKMLFDLPSPVDHPFILRSYVPSPGDQEDGTSTSEDLEEETRTEEPSVRQEERPDSLCDNNEGSRFIDHVNESDGLDSSSPVRVPSLADASYLNFFSPFDEELETSGQDAESETTYSETHVRQEDLQKYYDILGGENWDQQLLNIPLGWE